MKKLFATAAVAASLAACSDSNALEAKMGDTVVIYFEGYLDGVQFEGGTGTHPLTLGSGQFVPGFEEQVVGMKVGDEKDVFITFPTNYVPHLAGKDVVFKVSVQEIK